MIAMTVALSAPGFLDLPALELSTAQFYPLTQPEGIYVPYSYRANASEPSSASLSSSASSREIVRTLAQIIGIGSTCVLNRANLTMSDLVNTSESSQAAAAGFFWNRQYFGTSDSCRVVFEPNADIDIAYFSLFNALNASSNMT